MNLPVVWLPEAALEMKEAVARYAEIRPSLGLRFATAVAETIQAIAQAPVRFPVIEKGSRRAGVHRFPYGIFFFVEDGRIVVIACFHGKRDPVQWQSR